MNLMPHAIHSLTHTQERSTKISAHLQSVHSGTTHSVAALLDSGTTGMFIDREFVRRNRLETCPIPEPILVYNVDGLWTSMDMFRVPLMGLWIFMDILGIPLMGPWTPGVCH